MTIKLIVLRAAAVLMLPVVLLAGALGGAMGGVMFACTAFRRVWRVEHASLQEQLDG